MMKEQAAFEIIKLGLALAVFFGASIFYSRIKDRIGSGVDKEVFDYAVVLSNKCVLIKQLCLTKLFVDQQLFKASC